VGDDTDFVTLFACDLNLREKKLEYVNAGHCPALIKVDGYKIERLNPYLPALGFFPLEIEQKAVEFSHNIGVFLFTDGFYEWEVAPKKILGLDDFLHLAQELLAEDNFYLQELKDRLDIMPELPPVYRDDLTALWVEAK
jgi:sigma-B regulation protein RsbU (phosphoserine phosphatase)